MKMQIKGKNVEVTPALQEYVEKRLGKIEKYFPNQLQEIAVAMEVEKSAHHKIEVTVFLNGYLLRGEEVSNDMYTSIDNVVEKIERQIRKFKTRMYRKSRTDTIRDMGGSSPTVQEKEEPLTIVKTKRFSVRPMSDEEAVLQMELLGHSFFVFLNAETGEVNVVYKRHAGDYALIEPDLG